MPQTIIANLFNHDGIKYIDGGIINVIIDENNKKLLFEKIDDKTILVKNVITEISLDNLIDLNFNTEENYDLVITYKKTKSPFFNYIGLRFDKHSSSSFEIFMKKLEELKTNYTKVQYYESGNIKYNGVLNKEGKLNGHVILFYDCKGPNNVKFQGEMEDDMFMSGTFVNKEGDIFIVANNIVDNLPNGYINFITPNNKEDVLFENIVEDTKLNFDCSHDEFVNKISEMYFGKEYIEELHFKGDYKLYEKIKDIDNKLTKLNNNIDNHLYKNSIIKLTFCMFVFFTYINITFSIMKF